MLGLIIFGKKSVTTNLRYIRSQVCSICTHIYIRTDPITLPCSLARAGKYDYNEFCLVSWPEEGTVSIVPRSRLIGELLLVLPAV